MRALANLCLLFGLHWHAAGGVAPEAPQKRWAAVEDSGQSSPGTVRLLRSERGLAVSADGTFREGAAPSSLREREVARAGVGNATTPSPVSKCQEDPCADCQWTDWEEWSPCSVSCSGGSRSRGRAVKVQAEGDGQECVGDSSETEACGEVACPVDCEVSDWSDWSACEPFCHGTSNRSRIVQRPAENGGQACGQLSAVKSCTNFCMDCQLSEWNPWSSCTRSCAGGLRTRKRNEVYVPREYASSLLELGVGRAIGYEKKLGVRCDAAHQRTLDGAGKTPQEAQEACDLDPNCGGLYDQGCNNWLTVCDVGLVLEAEENACSYVKKEIGEGVPCTGDISEDEECSTQACPVDCRQSDWTDWTQCSPWCSGTSERTRAILQQPASGGVVCGSVAEVQNCTNECVDCVWGSWVAWSTCPVSCNGAKQQRSRLVLVEQSGRGKPCEGEASEVRSCGEIACPVDCEMDEWTDWTECSPYCKGSQSRTRSILTEPANGGKTCGETSLLVNCSNACVDCVVSSWSVWSPCSVTCGSGEQSRKRVILVEAEGQGAPCPESLLDEKYGCNATECPVDCAWEDWAPWNACPATCGGAMKNRTRGKMAEAKFGGVSCEGEATELGSCAEMVCPQDCLWSDWEAWGNCTRPCGGGEQSRYRYIKQDVMGEGVNCTGLARDERACNEDTCPKDCEFLDWDDWSSCSVTCGAGGNRTRSRKVDAEINGGAPCDPAVPLEEVVECGTAGCPRDCVWGDWGGWMNCSKTCGLGLNAGITSRHRLQSVTAAFGGKACEGKAVQTARCNEVLCPVDCEWQPWTPWTECIMPCGSNGTRERSRNKIAAAHGGEECVGDSTETSSCTVLGGCSLNCSWEDWNEWTACSSSCGEGNRIRFRFVADEARGPSGKACEGQPQEDEFCNPGVACPADCVFNDWKEWGACEPMPCGPAKKLRARTKLAARYGGRPCEGNSSEVEECTIPDGRVIECDENGKPLTTTTTTTTTRTNTTTTSTSTNTTTRTFTVTTTLPGTTTTMVALGGTTAGLTGEAYAAVIAAKAEESVLGTETLEVVEPEKFVMDEAAKKAVREAIAQEVGVSADAVIIKSQKVEPQAAILLQSHGSKARRKGTPSDTGRVTVSYEIVPEISGKTAEEVMETMEHLKPEEVIEAHQKTLLLNNAQKYSVKVEDARTVMVSKSTGNTVREADPVHARGRSTVTASLLVLLLVVCSHLSTWSS